MKNLQEKYNEILYDIIINSIGIGVGAICIIASLILAILYSTYAYIAVVISVIITGISLCCLISNCTKRAEIEELKDKLILSEIIKILTILSKGEQTNEEQKQD